MLDGIIDRIMVNNGLIMKIFIEDPQIFIRDPPNLLYRPQAFHLRPHKCSVYHKLFIIDPQNLIVDPRLSSKTPKLFIVWDPRLLLETISLSTETTRVSLNNQSFSFETLRFWLETSSFSRETPCSLFWESQTKIWGFSRNISESPMKSFGVSNENLRVSDVKPPMKSLESPIKIWVLGSLMKS